ncbi:MAG: hypothetical protein K8T91_16460 [Planctomycetes bacterium]|nr:hypothetical protein [Planctomycetota bacterium]
MRAPFIAILILMVGARWTRAEDDFERPPIQYSNSQPKNAVSHLQSRLEKGDVRLAFDDANGYLPSLLRTLRVPVESQMLVFSKTSMQRNRIAPKTPRAIYFNDDVYVGYCQSGEVLEISVADPSLGAVFYTLEQKPATHPVLTRQTGKCLQCHSTSRTGDVPSHLVRSVFTDAEGLPMLSEGSFRIDHTTPLENRWGGWYVTGTHGNQSHLGNLVIRESPVPRPVQNPEGHNVTDLSKRLHLSPYLSPHSDIVALMVFEHQTTIHNLITQANFSTRQALHYQAVVNRALGQAADAPLESTSQRIAHAGDSLVKGLLFAEEAPLGGPIQGTSGFAEEFMRRGLRDTQGRSLRDLDLKTRMFKYPCSYLIYSPAFDELPRVMKDYVATRLKQVLNGSSGDSIPNDPHQDASDFAHLSKDDRFAIREIVKQTKPGFLPP